MFTIKKFVEFLSVRRISNGFPVVSDAPAEVMLTLVAAAVVPRPICFALTPPVPVVAFAPDAFEVV